MTLMKPLARIGTILLVFTVMGFGTASADQVPVDLELTKVLQTGGPVFSGEPLVWVITLRNNGTANATNITVTDNPSGLGDYTLTKAIASAGSFGNLAWKIPELANGSAVTLTLTTVINGTGEKVNLAAITASDQPDPDPADNTASASTGVGRSATAFITIKPETLNLKSRGVFTVFIRFSGEFPVSGINLRESRLICNGAAPQRFQVNQKDGGTVMAKYRRQDLVNVTAGQAVTITCNGTISAGGELVKVSGSDTIRVIGEKKKGLDAFLAGILDTILPTDDDGGDKTAVNETTAIPGTTSSGDNLNRGQLKKAERNGGSGCTGNCNVADSGKGQGNGKKNREDDQGSVSGGDEKGNKGKGNDDTNANGNGKGKGNDNKSNNGKGNGKNKE